MDRSISKKLISRFIKDSGVPINVYDPDIFAERIALLDSIYGCASKYQLFLSEIDRFVDEEEYFTESNRLTDAVISHVSNTSGYKRFILDADATVSDFLIYVPQPNGSIFSGQNCEKCLLSIDMVKANFSSLRSYSSDIFLCKESWEEFISVFTNLQHMTYSKHVRQVIMGNCNPKRQRSYEEKLLSEFLGTLFDAQSVLSKNDIIAINADEVVFSLDDSFLDISTAKEKLREFFDFVANYSIIPLRAELFTLKTIVDVDKNDVVGYIKNNILNGKTAFKCIQPYLIPFVIRKINGMPPVDSDLIVPYEGRYAKLTKVPHIEII